MPKEKIISVTLCAAAYNDLVANTSVVVPIEEIENVVEVEEGVGIGRSIIFLYDGSSMNVVEGRLNIKNQIGKYLS